MVKYKLDKITPIADNVYSIIVDEADGKFIYPELRATFIIEADNTLRFTSVYASNGIRFTDRDLIDVYLSRTWKDLKTQLLAKMMEVKNGLQN